MNLPTKLTVLRIFMTFIIIIILIFPFYSIGINFNQYVIDGVVIKMQYLVAGVLFIIASITDFIDGYLARKNNQVTDLGKMLDAIADKILVNSVLIILAYQGFISIVVPVVCVLRDTMVDAIKMEAARKGKVVAAIKSGKIKTATLMVGVTFAFFYNLPFELIGINFVDFLLIIAVVMSIVSGIEYFVLNRKIIFDSKVEVNN
ncbi:MAG: CDP-diacylglycerol--glycerol-3-phosphate 3-phosphatidyltransferase [Bacilli bacterium]|nr:CDP-diacylglycerol--glycerol-3-phosphate 3-phosphatidyltransferase [Bacilli bacterium]